MIVAVWLSSFIAGCAMLKKNNAPVEAIAVDDQTPTPAAPASVQISYAKPDDTLQSVVVSSFTGANVLRTVSEGDNEATVMRFDGGVTIWKFHANRNLLNPLSKKPYRVDSVEYGKVPSNFTQDTPEVGPPPPLDAGGYYIFAIQRTSGAISYQAVRVRSDFSLQAFDAEPRAGTSYKLCCDVGSDFAEPTPENGAEPVENDNAPTSPLPELQGMPSPPPDSEQQP
jgi:hypothetical protein